MTENAIQKHLMLLINGSMQKDAQEGDRMQGWESVFWGGTIMSEDLKDPKIDRPKIPRFHHPPSIIPKVSTSFQHYFRFRRICLCSKIIHNYQRFTKIPPSFFIFYFYWKRLRLNIVLDPAKQIIKHLVSHTFQHFEFLGFPKCWDMQRQHF